eukprot:SAG31_NODE_965_length_10696_cov_10.487213_5_plen_350_part_00
MNSAQAVLNPQLLPTDPAARAKMVVIVLMVHNRPKYFARVVKSLRAVRGVRDALLVVSLDFLSAEMDAVARSIDFMPVVQIFCPAAAQLYPTSFPGTDPRDCAGGWVRTSEMQLCLSAVRLSACTPLACFVGANGGSCNVQGSPTRAEAKRSGTLITQSILCDSAFMVLACVGCLNWATPDKFGHYREAKFTAVKHHWWWQFNFVFSQLKVTTNEGSGHTGWVLYVEEDNYLAPDVMATLNQMIGLAESGQAGACGAGGEGCPLLNLGLKRQEAVSDLRSLGTQGDAVAIDGWQSSKHNMGLAFKRSFWDKLAGCGPGFCGYDDYNWDWSLQATMVSTTRTEPKNTKTN